MSSTPRAFALKESRDLDSVGAIVINAAGSDLNVREVLEHAPDGVYVTSDPDQIRALDGYEPVKAVSVPEPRPEKRHAAAKGDGKGE